MYLKSQLLCTGLLTFVIACVASAESPQRSPVDALLISPDVVMRFREQIGVTEEQAARIRAGYEEAKPKVDLARQAVNEATGRLAELLSSEDVDEDATLKQLDVLLSAENNLKRLHMQVMIRLRNELSSQQRKIAIQVQQAHKSADNPEMRLKAKLSRIEKEIQTRAQGGHPPFDVVGLMQKFPELMQNGQAREAEALLDRVMKILALEQSGNQGNNGNSTGAPAKLAEKLRRLQERAQAMQKNGEDVSAIQQLMQKLAPLVQQGKAEEAEKLVDEAFKRMGGGAKPKGDAPTDKEEARPAPKATFLKPYSPTELQTEVAALKKQDVAWRKIEWKTCLLDGLKASHEQNKPVMLWIFIDRPIDDERC
ncbi:MAG: periplasmic heavy metal sensor [Planctomycetes bacterium]|nr:periplasmic heavy metal sensor [Planctomycetota bacterium]